MFLNLYFVNVYMDNLLTITLLFGQILSRFCKNSPLYMGGLISFRLKCDENLISKTTELSS